MSEFERRRTALAALLAEKQVDAMLVAFLPNVRYLTGYTGSSGLLVLASSGEATFFNRVNRLVFSRLRLARALYPTLVRGRKLLLRLLGRKLIGEL